MISHDCVLKTSLVGSHLDGRAHAVRVCITLEDWFQSAASCELCKPLLRGYLRVECEQELGPDCDILSTQAEIMPKVLGSQELGNEEYRFDIGLVPEIFS